MVSILQKIFLVFLFFNASIASAQLKFSATVSSPEIGKNEFAQYKLTLENAKQVEKINTPDFKNFTVVSGPNQESGMTVINGNVKQYTALNFILKPTGTGNFTIPGTTARADGKELQSNPVTIKVTNSSSSNSGNNPGNNPINLFPFAGIDPFADVVPEKSFNDNILKKGENITDKINKNIFVKLDVDKTSCYVGEPVVATYKLYTRLKSESNLSKSPSFNGFSVIDLQQNDYGSYKHEKLNGRDYNVYTIRKSQLYPLQPGNFELDPAEVENNISFIKEAYAKKLNNFGDGFFGNPDDALPNDAIITQKVTLSSKPVSINVMPLPSQNVPPGFKGAVGDFTIDAKPVKTSFTTDDAGKIQFTISGQGNLQLINIPEIQWPQGFESFEPTSTDNFDNSTVPVSGQKNIVYTFSIADQGTYVLPPIKFSFFNPKEKKYIIDSTKPMTFSVTKGTGKNTSVVNRAKTENESALNKFFKNRLRVASTVAILIILGLLFWLKRDKKNEEKQIHQKQDTPVEDVPQAPIIVEEKDWLEKAGSFINSDSNQFYHELNYALKKYLATKFHLPLETISKKSISEAMEQNNIGNNLSIQVEDLMNQIESQLYTPFADKEKMQEMFNNTEDIISLLDTYKI